MSVEADLPLGTAFLDYLVEGVLGRGGMGIVYLAEDQRLKRRVALKLLAPRLADDERFRERLLVESELAASIDHPNIIPIYAAGEVDGRIFIAMRYVEGEDLHGRLRREPRPSPREVLALVSQLASALDAAHARGLVHGDVKPSNVLVAPGAGRDDEDHVYLADFGLTRRLSRPGDPADEGYLMGTVDYVAPEQIRGDAIDGRTDVYSLGCLLVECLTGEPPFRHRSDVELLFAHLEEDPPALSSRRPDLGKEIDGVCARALAKSPDERYETCRQLVDAARGALGLEAGPARARNRTALATVVGAAVVAAAVAVALIVSDGSRPRAAPGSDEVIRIDPATNRVAARVAVGRGASGVAVGDRTVWVTNLADGTISQIDPRTRATRTILGRGNPSGVAIAGGAAVVADGDAHKLTAFEAATGTVSFPAPLQGQGNGTIQVAGGASGVWFADPAAGIVARADNSLTAGTPIDQLSIPRDTSSFVSAYRSFDGLAVGDSAVWVAGDAFEHVVWRIDTRRRTVRTIRLPFVPGQIAAGDGAVWVASLLADTVARLDPATGRVIAAIPVGRGVAGIAAGAGAVWVANSLAGTVSRIDPTTNRVTATINLGASPSSIAAGSSGVWVTAAAEPPRPTPNAITIGVLSDCRGQFGTFYNDTLAAAELPLIEAGATRAGHVISDGIAGLSIAGRPIRLTFGCANGTSESGLREARRLVEQDGVDILVGPLTGDEGMALQRYARRHPGVTFVNGTSSAQNLDPAPNFFSFWYDGAQWVAGVGSYAYTTLGWRTAVTVAADDTFDWAQAAGFDAEFCSLGGTIVKRIWLAPGAQDFSGLAAEVPRAGVDGVFVEAPGTGALQALATNDPRLRGALLAHRVVLGTNVVPPPSLGSRLRGIVFAGPRPNAPARYLAKLRSTFPEISKDYLGSAFDYAYYDAMAGTLQALQRVRGDLSGRERRFMTALGKVVLDAPNGRTTLDSEHQAIAPTTLQETLVPPATSRPLRTIGPVDHTFGGYFGKDDAPPAANTPRCKRRGTG